MLKRSRTDPIRRRGPAKVLVVDDNSDAATLVARILRRAGFEVAEAHDYHVAIATMANEPDLAAVLSAFSIAGSGAALKLLDAVRNHSLAEVRDLPVIVISDHPRQSLFAWQAGADEMLVRPVDIDVLTEAVNDVLRRD